MTALNDFFTNLSDIRRSAEAVGYLIASSDPATVLRPQQTQIVLGGLWVLSLGLFQGFLADCLHEHYRNPSLPDPAKFRERHRALLTRKSVDLVTRALEKDERNRKGTALSERQRRRDLGGDVRSLAQFVAQTHAPDPDAFCVTRSLSPNKEFVQELLTNLGDKWANFVALFPTASGNSVDTAMLLLETAIEKRHDLAHSATRIPYPTKQELDTLLFQLEDISKAFDGAVAQAFTKLR